MHFNCRYSDEMDRILRNIDVDGKTGCWNWKLTKDKGGYGVLTIGSLVDKSKKVVKAHRYSYKCFVGEIPDGLMVLHRCDNRKCVNPGHLFIGTTDDNMRDMVQKGRSSRMIGETNGCAKLTNKEVIEIKRLIKNGERGADISRKTRASVRTISNIKHNKSWRMIGN